MTKPSFISKEVSIKRVLIAISIVIILTIFLFVVLLRLERRIRNTVEYFNPREDNNIEQTN
jgi:hypothetical protein